MIQEHINLFPSSTDFPVPKYNSEVALLIRLFPINDMKIRSKDLQYLNVALWSMRSHIINTDMAHFNVKPLFHIKACYYDRAAPILTGGGVPEDCLLAFPDDLCSTSLPGAIAQWKATAPILDSQLDTYDHVVVVDADTFSLKSDDNQPLPLIELSLNTFTKTSFTVLYDWYKPFRHKTHEVINWWACPMGLDNFIDKAAHWAGCSRAEYSEIMFNPEISKPLLNGLYINLPMPWLREDKEFRRFIHDCSSAMGHEEIALHIWSLRHYFQTGEQLPIDSLANHVNHAADFTSYRQSNPKEPRLLHAVTLEGVEEHAVDFAASIGATPEDANNFASNTAHLYSSASNYKRS